MRPRTTETGCLMLGGGEFVRALSRRLADGGAQVERPEFSARRSPAETFARRNLCFCVSEILIFDGADAASLKETDALCRGLCSAQIWRVPGENDDAQTAARFLLAEDARSAFPPESGAATLC